MQVSVVQNILVQTSAKQDFDFGYPHLTKLIKDSSYVCLLTCSLPYPALELSLISLAAVVIEQHYRHYYQSSTRTTQIVRGV